MKKMFIINTRKVEINVVIIVSGFYFARLLCKTFIPISIFNLLTLKGNHKICINDLVKSEKTNCVLLFLVHIFPVDVICFLVISEIAIKAF